jgi:putative transposase
MFAIAAFTGYDRGCHAARHVRFALAPTPAQAAMLVRYAGASRFAYNQCLRLVTDARRCGPSPLGDAANHRHDPGPRRHRRLRRLLRPVEHLDPDTRWLVVAPRAKILFATVSRHGSRWYVSLNVQAPDFHAERRHLPRPSDDRGGFVGVDRGLVAFAVAATADGTEVGRFHAPKPLQRGMVGLRRRSRAVSRAQPRSSNRAKATRRLSRQHARIANMRRSFLHEVSSKLVQTHDRLCLEDLTVANLMGNRRLARAIGDAAWTELGRQLTYKAAWLGAELVVCDRWFASTKTCSGCGMVKQQMRLAERIYRCDRCGRTIDRDHNAAANLAAWAERSHAQAPDRQAGGRVNNAPGGEGAGHRRGDGATSPNEGGTDARALLV